MLADIVRAKVKPERDLLGNNPNNVPLKRRWWAYQAHRPELYARIRKLERALVNSQVSGHLAFAFLPSSWIYAHTLNVFDIADFSAFSVLQSRPHEIWARFLGSSMKDDLRYTASDCFETFPFPRDYTDNSTLCEAGRRYYEFRTVLMTGRGEGLTKTYNRFNDPEESSGEIAQLRELHDSMDRCVLDAYGWAGILPKCEFMPEFDEADEEEEDIEHPRKKKYRYRWPDEIRDKVLAGLLELNHQRSLEEGQSDVGQMAVASTLEAKPKTISDKKSKKKKAMQDTSASLFAVGEGEA
jgi:hypothetical protein